MAKYRVLNTTILHNGESQGEGSIIELTDEQAKKLADYVEKVEDTEVSNTSGGSDTSNNADTSGTSNNLNDNSGQAANQTQNEPINLCFSRFSPAFMESIKIGLYNLFAIVTSLCPVIFF